MGWELKVLNKGLDWDGKGGRIGFVGIEIRVGVWWGLKRLRVYLFISTQDPPQIGVEIGDNALDRCK